MGLGRTIFMAALGWAAATLAQAGVPDACHRANDAADAKVVIETCLESTDTSQPADDRATRLYYRAYAFVELGRLDEAAAELKKAIAIAPGMASLHHELAYIQVEFGEFDAAEASAAEAMRLEPNDASHAQERGFARLAKGDYAGAAADFEKAQRLTPSRTVAGMYAYALAMAGDLDGARLELSKLDNALDQSSNDYRDLARTVVSNIKSADDTPAARETCIRAFNDMKIEARFASICTWGFRAATTPKDRADTIRFRSFIWQYALKLEEPAKSDVEAAVRLNPTDSGVLGQRCTTLRDTATRRRQVERGIKDCTRAIELCDKPDCKTSMRLNRAWSYMTIKEYDSAIADANAIIEAWPKRPDGYHVRGAAKLKKGDREGAKTDLLKAKELGGDSDDLKERLKEVGA